MGRRRSVFEDLLMITTNVPWWVGLCLAVASYFTLYALSVKGAPAAAATDLASITNVVQKQLITTFASLFQYLLPAIFTLGAAGSVYKRLQGRHVDKRACVDGAMAIDGMTWREFERLIGEAFRIRGFAVSQRGGSGADGGVDLALTKGRERFLVQCKHWRAQQVGVAIIRELYGVMAATGATGGIVVTSGRFTRDAEEFADGRNLELIDGRALAALLSAGASALPARGESPAA